MRLPSNNRAVFLLLFTLSPLAGLCGCASLVRGTSQEVAIQAVHQDKQVFGATCTLTNDKGTKSVKTPGVVLIGKSYGYLEVTCTKPGLPSGTLRAESRTGGEIFGNILFGGLIGAGIDASSAAAYKYQYAIIVQMGKSRIFETSTTKPEETSTQ